MEEFYTGEFGKEKEPTLKDKVDASYQLAKAFSNLDEKEKEKMIKKLKLPRKARVGKWRMRKGYCGVLFVNENRTISGQKVQLDGGTYKTKDGNYHVTNGNELHFWEGKFPILWQRYDKLNPTNLLAKAEEKNEVYGQDMVMLRMKRDLIKEKKKGGGIGWLYIVLILGAGYFLLKTFFPSMFGG